MIPIGTQRSINKPWIVRIVSAKRNRWPFIDWFAKEQSKNVFCSEHVRKVKSNGWSSVAAISNRTHSSRKKWSRCCSTTKKSNWNVWHWNDVKTDLSSSFNPQFILDFTDRQRNEEKKQMAQEENVRLEREKERKRKALTLSKVSRSENLHFSADRPEWMTKWVLFTYLCRTR